MVHVRIVVVAGAFGLGADGVMLGLGLLLRAVGI
jgi:hypothetical protein|tara:strand:+ start:267 stop:368 length:102 start_codon:yes stop_codon:yes gene_type:complete